MDQDGTESIGPNAIPERIPLNEGFRQHPIKIAEEVLAVAILTLFIFFSIFLSLSGSEGPDSGFYAIDRKSVV